MSYVYTVFDQKQKLKEQQEKMNKIIEEMDSIMLPPLDLLVEVSKFMTQYVKHMDDEEKSKGDLIVSHQYLMNLMSEILKRTIIFSMYCITVDAKFDTTTLMKNYLRLPEQKQLIETYHQILVENNNQYLFDISLMFDIVDSLRKDAFSKSYHAQKSLKAITLLPSTILDARKNTFNQYSIKNPI